MRRSRTRIRGPISVAEDFPVQIRKARESLLPQLREVKDRGKRAVIAWPAKLIVDNVCVKEVNVVEHSRSQNH